MSRWTRTDIKLVCEKIEDILDGRTPYDPDISTAGFIQKLRQSLFDEYQRFPFPFGQFRDIGVLAVWFADSKYVDWVLKQDWCQERYPEWCVDVSNFIQQYPNSQ